MDKFDEISTFLTKEEKRVLYDFLSKNEMCCDAKEFDSIIMIDGNLCIIKRFPEIKVAINIRAIHEQYRIDSKVELPSFGTSGNGDKHISFEPLDLLRFCSVLSD